MKDTIKVCLINVDISILKNVIISVERNQICPHVFISLTISFSIRLTLSLADTDRTGLFVH